MLKGVGNFIEEKRSNLSSASFQDYACVVAMEQLRSISSRDTKEVEIQAFYAIFLQ